MKLCVTGKPTVQRMSTEPPAAFTNVILAEFMVCPDGRWHVCHGCTSVATRKIREEHLGTFRPDYITHLLSARPTDPLMLSVVQCNVRFSSRIAGFLHTADTVSPYLLRGPLVYWAGLPPVASVADLPQHVR